MTNEERALKLAKSITSIVFTDYCNQEGVNLILAYADEIRLECAETIETTIKNKYQDWSNINDMIASLRSAILDTKGDEG